MIDGSKRPLAENIEATRKAVEIAHPAGVSVEAELGKVGLGSEDISKDEREKFMTDPEEARKFVEETNVDFLAVAIGSAHGFYNFKPDLDFERLKAIRSLVEIPLVLHGGSDLPDDQIRRSVKMGITKVNVHTDISAAYTTSLREFVASNEGIIWPGRVLITAREPMKELIRTKIRLFAASGMAK